MKTSYTRSIAKKVLLVLAWNTELHDTENVAIKNLKDSDIAFNWNFQHHFQFPQSWKITIIVPIRKGNGDSAGVENHIGTSRPVLWIRAFCR